MFAHFAENHGYYGVLSTSKSLIHMLWCGTTFTLGKRKRENGNTALYTDYCIFHFVEHSVAFRQFFFSQEFFHLEFPGFSLLYSSVLPYLNNIEFSAYLCDFESNILIFSLKNVAPTCFQHSYRLNSIKLNNKMLFFRLNCQCLFSLPRDNKCFERVLFQSYYNPQDGTQP